MLMMILTIDGITRVCLSKRAEIREELLKLCQVGPWIENMRLVKNKNYILDIFIRKYEDPWYSQTPFLGDEPVGVDDVEQWTRFFFWDAMSGKHFLFEWVTWTSAFQPNTTFFAHALVISMTITRNQVLFSLSMPLAEQNYQSQSLKWSLFRIILLSFFVFLISRTLFFMETLKR